MMYSTKKDMVYDNLKKEILNGELKVGEKLVISKLAKRFKVSEIPVREALSHLKSENLIEVKIHAGAIVAPLSPKDLQDIFDLRIELEGLAVRLAVEYITNDDLNSLEKILEQSEDSLRNKQYSRFGELNREFHFRIYKRSNNKLLCETINNLWNNTNRYPSLFKHNKLHNETSMNEHFSICEALKTKDSILAEKLMLKHKARAFKEVIKLTQQQYYARL